MTTLTPPLKWHGGKHYLARRIVALMPPHVHYVEPFAGGLSVLLAKDPEKVSEVVNDIDTHLTNFWRVLADTHQFAHMQRIAEATPFSEPEWDESAARLDDPDPAARAVAFFVRCRQSLAGRQDNFAAISRNRIRRGMNEQASAWLSAVEGLPAVHERLKRVVILCRSAEDVIRTQDGPGTLFYCDPPYVPEARTAPKVYAHEMTLEQHGRLLQRLSRIKGKFLLSGYDHWLYQAAAERWGWHRHEFDVPNHAAGGETKRRMTEVVWTNFAASVARIAPADDTVTDGPQSEFESDGHRHGAAGTRSDTIRTADHEFAPAALHRDTKRGGRGVQQ
ncbi:MAG: DNA adenine methylase [Gemmataceae bacterium]